MHKAMRKESDLLGEAEVPADALYGIQTQRAAENFPLNGQRCIGDFPTMAKALIKVKKAACLANKKAGLLTSNLADAISAACDDALNHDSSTLFPIHHLHGGGGTSANMNANEVIANIAEEKLGGKRGEYRFVHPNDHVNLNQSTNDVYPSACHIAIILSKSELVSALENLTAAFDKKGKEFASQQRIARTCLQDAVAVSFQDFFSGYTSLLKRTCEHIKSSIESLYSVPLGGTIVGRIEDVPAQYMQEIIPSLRDVLQDDSYSQSSNFFDAVQNIDDMVRVSASLETAARSMIKICRDLRLMSSGPETGLSEIFLPAVQPGSSIMPGKVNPVIPEHTIQLCFKVLGKHSTSSAALEHGELDLNIWESTVVFSVLESMELLAVGTKTLTEKCVNGLRINPERNTANVNTIIPKLTELMKRHGYSRINDICKKHTTSIEALKNALDREFPNE